METKIVLIGIARSKGKAKAEAMVFSHGVFTPTTRWDYWSQPKEKRLDMEKDHPLYILAGIAS